jgi:hypothetical protein
MRSRWRTGWREEYCVGVDPLGEGTVAAVEVGIDGGLAEGEGLVGGRLGEVIIAHKIINLKVGKEEGG